jgi:phosphomannomutase
VIGAYDYVFAENGLVAYKGDQLIGKQSLRTHLGEERIKEFVNFILHYVSAVLDCADM